MSASALWHCASAGLAWHTKILSSLPGPEPVTIRDQAAYSKVFFLPLLGCLAPLLPLAGNKCNVSGAACYGLMRIRLSSCPSWILLPIVYEAAMQWNMFTRSVHGGANGPPTLGCSFIHPCTSRRPFWQRLYLYLSTWNYLPVSCLIYFDCWLLLESRQRLITLSCL